MACQRLHYGEPEMSVTSISKRTIEQSTSAPLANPARTGQDAAAEFASALQKASSSLFGAATTRTAGAAGVLAASLDAQAERAQRNAEADQAQRAADDKPAQRSRPRVTERAAPRLDDDRARSADTRADSADAVDAADERDTARETAEDGRRDDNEPSSHDNPALAADPVAPPPAAPVTQAPQFTREPAGADGSATDAAADALAARQAAQQAQTAGSAAQNAQADAARQAAAGLKAPETAAQPAAPEQTQAPAQPHTAAEAQAQDLARRLDDTGAQLKVQVAVTATSETAAQSTTPATSAADALLPQDVAAVAAPAGQTGADANGSADGQDAGLAANAPAPAPQPVAPQAAGQQQQQTFNAALAQAEAAAGTQGADAQTAKPGQAPQPVAALANAGANAAAGRAQAPQAAHAARQAQLPQAQDVVDQIAVHIAKNGKDGADSIKVQLKPVELGTIEIKVEMNKDGTASAVVTADNKETLDLLKKDQSSLQKALEQAGVKTDSNSLTFNLREGGQQQASQQQNQGSAVARRRARMAAAAAADAASAQSAAAAQARWGVGRSGVDIQV